MVSFKSLAEKARQKLQKLSSRSSSHDSKGGKIKPRSNAIRVLVEREISRAGESSAAGGNANPHTIIHPPPTMTSPNPEETANGPAPVNNGHCSAEMTSSQWSWSPPPDAISSSTSDDRESINPFLETAFFAETQDTIDPERPSREYGRARFGYRLMFSDSPDFATLDRLYTESDYIDAFFEEAAAARMLAQETVT